MYLDWIVKNFNHPCYNFAIDPFLLDLIDKNISLTSYFNSNLPIFRIDNRVYPKIHSNEETLIVSCKDFSSP